MGSSFSLNPPAEASRCPKEYWLAKLLRKLRMLRVSKSSQVDPKTECLFQTWVPYIEYFQMISSIMTKSLQGNASASSEYPEDHKNWILQRFDNFFTLKKTLILMYLRISPLILYLLMESAASPIYTFNLDKPYIF